MMLGGCMTKNVELLFCAGSATEVAVTITLKLAETDEGAWYVAEVVVTLESVPQDAPAHPGPERLQVTPLFAVSLVRLTANCKVCP